MTFIYLNNIESNLKYTLENGQDAIESLDRYTGKGLFRHLRK